MAPRAAAAVLDDGAMTALRRVTDLAGGVLDDFGTAGAHAVLRDVELLVTGWGCPPLDAAALDSAPRLRAVVHTAGSVRAHVTEACWERGIAVTSAAAANAVPVAEYTVAMILLSGKRVWNGLASTGRPAAPTTRWACHRTWATTAGPSASCRRR